MSIDFNPKRWESLRETYSLWWKGKLEHPIIPVVLTGKAAGRQNPGIPVLSQSNCHDFSVSAKDIIDRIDYELSTFEYLGDAFPYFNLDCFGPGVVSAFLGAELSNSTGSVWFHPKKVLPISELHFEYDSNNIWLNRIKNICAEAMKLWHGQVLIGMADLGGVLDILSTFRSTDNLLMDLYDEPEEVNRLVWEIHELWHRFYNEIHGVLNSDKYGYTDWSGIYSPTSSYITQSDFSFMISPSMFDQFTKPELEATCRKLHNTIYHLDGVGQLNHLNSLLEIKELNAVQWVPGDGKPDQSNWPEVYKSIQTSKKNIQLFHGFDCMDKVIDQLGSVKGLHHMLIKRPSSEKGEIIKKLAKYGIE